jgi:hypothetical protein
MASILKLILQLRNSIVMLTAGDSRYATSVGFGYPASRRESAWLGLRFGNRYIITIHEPIEESNGMDSFSLHW